MIPFVFLQDLRALGLRGKLSFFNTARVSWLLLQNETFTLSGTVTQKYRGEMRAVRSSDRVRWAPRVTSDRRVLTDLPTGTRPAGAGLQG